MAAAASDLLATSCVPRVTAVAERGDQLDHYGLGEIWQLDTDLGPKPAVRLKTLDGWRIWEDLVGFCEAASESLEAFIEDLEFSRLDAEPAA